MRRTHMKAYLRYRKWIVLTAVSAGTVMQLASCQNDLALFGVRWAFTSFTLPINVFIRDVLQTVI